MSAPSWVRPGVKVVCVDDRFLVSDRHYGETLPVKGGIYTIRGTRATHGWTGLLLVEIVNRPHLYDEGYGECDFNASRFRPLVSPGMEILNAILTNTPKDARVPDEVDA